MEARANNICARAETWWWRVSTYAGHSAASALSRANARSGRIQAVSGICTHQGCRLHLDTPATGYVCPCHGATFDLNGQHPTAPAFSPLDHYSVCVDGSGTIYVNYNSVVSASARF